MGAAVEASLQSTVAGTLDMSSSQTKVAVGGPDSAARAKFLRDRLRRNDLAGANKRLLDGWRALHWFKLVSRLILVVCCWVEILFGAFANEAMDGVVSEEEVGAASEMQRCEL